MPASWLSSLSAPEAHFLLCASSHRCPDHVCCGRLPPVLIHTLHKHSSAFPLLSGSQANHPRAVWFSPSGPWPLYPKQREAADCLWPRYFSASAHFSLPPNLAAEAALGWRGGWGGRLLDAGTPFLPCRISEVRIYFVTTQYGHLSYVEEWVRK